MVKKGVVLLNMGGPDSLDAIRPFLFNLFSDPYIADFGLMQKPIAWLISSLRSGKVKKAYEKIGGKSPLKEITIAQAEALEKALKEKFKVLPGMRYWHPFVEEALEIFEKEKIENIIAFSLYPQFCTATTKSVIEKFKEVAKGKFNFKIVDSWFDHPLFIDAWIENIEKSLSIAGDNAFVLFSAHGIPLSLHKSGDPYVEQVEGTVKAIVDKMKLEKWAICYQSRTGPVKWVEPSTEKMIESLAKKKVKKALIVPVSFVSDHIETLYEIDIVYKNQAKALGLELYRVNSLNTSPRFIEALKTIVLEKDEAMSA